MTDNRSKPDAASVEAARIEVERSRARLMTTAQELQERISPKTLAANAWQSAREKGADLAEDAVDVVKARPVAAGGAVAALTLFLARHPLMDLAGKAWGGVSGKRRKTRTAKKTKDTETVE
jgi:hypothetical protein